MYKLVGSISNSGWLYRWKTMRKKIFSDVNEIIARLSVWISLPLGIMMCWASKNIEYCSKTSFLDGLGAVSVIFLTIIRKTARDGGHEKSWFAWPDPSKSVLLNSIHHVWIASAPEQQSVAKQSPRVERFFRSGKKIFFSSHNFFWMLWIINQNWKSIQQVYT